MRLRLLALAVLAACAAGPIAKGDKPAWVSTPNGDVRFPADRFIAQVGTVRAGKKAAPEVLQGLDAAAREQVAQVVTGAIRAEVQGEPDAEQRVARLVQDLNLASAIEIQGRWREGDTAYAWAVFDKQKALAAQQGKVEGHQKLARDLLAQGAAVEAEKPAEALRADAQARSEAAASIEGGPLVRALGGTFEPGDLQAQAERKVFALLGELTLSVVEGDQQRVADNKPLPQPLVFTAWLKGKRAAGLPVAVTVANGGSVEHVLIGPEGKAEVRVADAGKFAGAEQQIQIAVDWPVLLGVAAAPAWLAAGPRAGISAVALRKGVGSTRVLVLIYEKVEGGAAVSDPPVAERLTASLRQAGFDVQNGRALLDKFGAERISKMSDVKLREAAKRVAEVVVIGRATSRSTAGASSARAEIRAIDVGTGAVVFTAPTDEVQGKRPGDLNVAGRSALEALGEALGPNLGAALKKAAER